MSSQQGASMIPLLTPKDKPIIKPFTQPAINDIVAYRAHGQIVVHRVIYLSKDLKYLITKGDNNFNADRKLKSSQILGAVRSVLRNGQQIPISHIYLQQSVSYLSELTAINKQMNKNKIEYLILKGLPIHLAYVNSPPKRLYLDADILVSKKDLSRTKKLLKKLGYKEIMVTLAGKKVRNSTQTVFSKNREPFPVIIDLHSESALGFTKLPTLNKLMPVDNNFDRFLFANLKKVSINGHRFPILNLEAAVIYLLMHFYHHNFQGSYRMDLIRDIVHKNPIDWDKLAVHIQSFRLSNFIYPSVKIINKYYPGVFPEKFIKKVKPHFFEKLISTCIAASVTPFNFGARSQEGLKRFIFLIALSPESFIKKLEIILSPKIRDYFLPTIKAFLSSSLTNRSKSTFADL